MNRLHLFVAVLLSSLPGAGYQAPSAGATLTAEEEKESYQIYSTLLEEQDSHAEWAIVQHTKAFDLCLHPSKEQESIYRPLLDDYAAKNKQGFVLGPYFNLPAYTVVKPEELGKNTRSRMFAVLSAIGFNRDHTRAAVCLWAGSGGGACHVLIKKDDIWQRDQNWRGDGCGWAA